MLVPRSNEPARDVWDELLFRAMQAQQAMDEAMTHLRHAEAACDASAAAALEQLVTERGKGPWTASR